jgi:phosphotriesterase-related protein
MKVVRAAARAQRATGAMLNVHQIYSPGVLSAHTLADAIEASGGDLNRTVFSHMDGTEVDFEYQVSLIERGITIEYDVFGMECYFPSLDLQLPQDVARVQGIKRLVDAGHAGRIVLAQDICMKMMMEKYGGWGYGHILKRVLPRFRRAGVTDEQLTTMLVDNPRRLLPFVAPQT